MQQGWRLLADDLVAITPESQVLPGIPRIKLWHDAAIAFGLKPDALPPIRQGMQKYSLLGEAIERAVQPSPLKAMYLIQQQRQEGNDPDHNRITYISSQKQATLQLRNKTFRPRFIRGLGQEGANFIALARLQQQVPLATLPTPRGIAEMQSWLQEQSLLSAALKAERCVANSMARLSPTGTGQLSKIRQHLVPCIHYRAAPPCRPRQRGSYSRGSKGEQGLPLNRDLSTGSIMSSRIGWMISWGSTAAI